MQRAGERCTLDKKPHFYKESMALRAFRNCVACRNAPRSYFFLERSGSDRRTSDPDGVCRIFRWEAGLSDSGGNISDFSVLQTKIFIWGNAVSPSFYWGFLSENKSITGVLWYLIQMSGVFFVGAVLIVFFLRERRQRAALVSFYFH